MSTITVLVNSTDSYEDCWVPFFTLFQRYWPDCPYPLVLNTERKQFQFPSLDVRSSCVGPSRHPGAAGWSESLVCCLQQLQSDYILYLQEDYFLSARVDQSLIAQFVEIMTTERYSHIRLMEQPVDACYRPHERYPLLWEIAQRAVYRIALQAGLWRRQSLISYLKLGESGWQFERWGTLRAHAKHDSFYCQNLDVFNRAGRHVIPYTPTGIVGGKWYESAVVDLFQRNGLTVDYAARGFWRPSRYDRIIGNCRRMLRIAIMRYAPAKSIWPSLTANGAP
jgi:hypothetical protein